MVNSTDTITYGSFIIGLRQYLEDQLGITSVWRYQGYTPPESTPYIAVRYVNSAYEHTTKLNEMVTQNVYLQVACYGTDVIQLAEMHGELIKILLNHSIPLRNSSGEEIGKFSVSRITGDNEFPFESDVQEEFLHFSTYTDFAVELAHIKKRI